jgi:hypothetical protein
MFKSHLDAPHHASHALLAGHPGMGATADITDPNAPQSPGMVTDVVLPAAPDQPAPMPAAAPTVFAGMTAKQLMIAGGIAVAVFVLLKVLVKR